MTRFSVFASIQFCKHLHHALESILDFGCLMDRVLIRQKLQLNALLVTGVQMDNSLLLVSSTVPFSWRIRLVVSFSLSISANIQFGPSLFALKSLKLLIICSWLDHGIKNFPFSPFKVESKPNQLETKRILASIQPQSLSSQKETTWWCLAVTRRLPYGTVRESISEQLARCKTGFGQPLLTHKTKIFSLEVTTVPSNFIKWTWLKSMVFTKRDTLIVSSWPTSSFNISLLRLEWRLDAEITSRRLPSTKIDLLFN